MDKITSRSPERPPSRLCQLNEHITSNKGANKGKLTIRTNVEIVNRRFKTTAAVKTGAALLHPDLPLGVAARDIEMGEIIEYSGHKDTKDVLHMRAQYSTLEVIDADTS